MSRNNLDFLADCMCLADADAPSIVLSLKPWAVTVMAPSAVLVTEATYLVVTLACDVPAPVSQPQPFTPGGLEALRDW